MSDSGRVAPEGRAFLRFLVFSASLRSGSLNKALANLASQIIKANGGDVDLGSMSDFDAPSYDADVWQADGLPPGAQALRERLEICDAFVIASPEYNASVPGGLKNVIDWVSRYQPQPFNERHCLLLSASPSMVGGNRGLWALRVPLEHLGARIFPDMFSLSMAHKAFTGDDLTDTALTTRLEKTLHAFLSLAEAAKHYPCVKRAWVEFLGETPGTPADRVDPVAGAS